MEKRYNFAQIEKQMQEFWEEEQIYKFDPDAQGEIYSIDTPPPTVSGNMHVGHLFSYTQAEMIARFRRMQGYNVFYPFGFDDNGLPTERLVERDEGIRAKDFSRSAFINKCKQTTKNYETEFKKFWRTMGFSVDWSTQYETINDDVRKISQLLFLELVQKEKTYVKESPVLWCTECQTSIAQAELDTADNESTFIYIPFMVEGNPLYVATTRPELLYGCVCLFVHPDDERYTSYIGKNAQIPLYDYEVPILADDTVGIDKGTGVVMCATFGDSSDAKWYAEHALPYRKVILADGTLDKDVPFIGELTVHAARKEIIRLLDESNLLQKSENIIHAVAIHERCRKEIEIIPSRQWYIDILSEKERFLDAANQINWYPAYMKNRYIAWVENLKWDWCISRQRYFGVPFPVWYCNHCGKASFAKAEQLPVNPLETPYKGTCDCGCKEFTPESAVFDTWATSSLTPQIHERFGLKLTPMGMRTHAHEIIRTWTFYTIVRSLYHTGDIPWKDLMINGFVLAKKGEKISKSKENSEMEPEALVAAHSADVLRYWSANARLGTDTFFAIDELTIAKRFITKLWNASKFAISHLQDIDLSEKPQLLPVDRWIVERTNETIKKATVWLNEYEIGSARHELDELFWKDFCDNYIEIVKSRLYKPELHGYVERRSGQYALYYSLLNILKMYAVYIPHITEYIYQQFFKQHEKTASVHLLKWEKNEHLNDDFLEFGETIKEVISAMRKNKSDKNLSIRAEIDVIEIRTVSKHLEWFKQTEKDLKACSNAKVIQYISK
ncbi:valine--tRNA ligase [Bacillus sp. J14TS2]|uniref:valine--tRNA ligase n=1 Tax=Bacillus sp. J14TS2 TaxID=2807188 RepID=UPI001B2762F6|nr:valine--tRNA ligase [Bacillus sp. J14TS2]GIN73830.1 valine--tRNA ligase [Bacillus sp. J14TS2]